MALSFASATGNLFNRLGRLAKLVMQADAYQDAQYPNMTNTTTGVVAQYNGESDIQAQMGSAYLSILSSVETVDNLAQNIAVTTINRMVFRDQPQLNQNLESQNITASITTVIQQMQAAGATVLAMTIGATATAFVGTGNGVINSGTRRPLDGLVLENTFAETVTFTCTADSYSGGATAGNETFSMTGTGSENDIFAFDWPLGSNASGTVSAIDGNSDVASGNLLTNSGFGEWTANVPDNFTLEVGTAGTNVSEETTIVFGTGSSLKMTGDAGGTLTELTQLFDDSTGTLGSLSAQTQYSLNVFMRGGASPLTTGVLTFDLIDENENVILDAGGNANTFAVDLTTLNTTFVAFNTEFRTPVLMPTTVSLRFRLTTALTDGESFYMDMMSLGLMTQLYVSGPYFAVHSGSTNFVLGTYGTVVVTNSRGAAGSLATFQTAFARLFAPYVMENEYLLPSAASPSISDTLITS